LNGSTSRAEERRRTGARAEREYATRRTARGETDASKGGPHPCRALGDGRHPTLASLTLRFYLHTRSIIALTRDVALGDDHLLRERNLLTRDFNAHVATGDHNSCRPRRVRTCACTHAYTPPHSCSCTHSTSTESFDTSRGWEAGGAGGIGVLRGRARA